MPSERDLAKIHSVSLMTARHALASLEREGVVETPAGNRHVCLGTENSFQQADELHGTDGQPEHDGGSKVLFAKIIDDEQEANARLSLSPKSGVIKLERLRHAAGEPFALETCYLSAVQFPGLFRLRFRGNLCSGSWNATTKWRSDIQMKRWTPLQPILVPPIFGCAEARAGAANPAGDFFHERKGCSVRFGFLSFDRHNLVIRRFR